MVFLLVFLIALISCGQAMYILSNNAAKDDDKFVKDYFYSIIYMYRMSLGEISMDELNKLNSMLVYATFFIGTLFLTVVMLNILVAVICDIYVEVQEASLSELYKVWCDIIVEVEYMIPH